MKAPHPLQIEDANCGFYFCAAPNITPIWPSMNTSLWLCLSMLIAGVAVTDATFAQVVKGGKLDRLVYVLRGLGWPVKSHVAPSINGICDESKLSYFIGDDDKDVILEGEA